MHIGTCGAGQQPTAKRADDGFLILGAGRDARLPESRRHGACDGSTGVKDGRILGNLGSLEAGQEEGAVRGASGRLWAPLRGNNHLEKPAPSALATTRSVLSHL